MPIFIPPFLGENVKSNAERKVFEVLQDLRIENSYVLHSLGLPRHQTKVYGEVDFVVVCDRGVACLEIKGGRIECRDGVWIFTDRYSVERTKSESPFAQATGNMFSLRGRLLEKFGHQVKYRSMLAACGVMFPDIDFSADSSEVISEIIWDRGVGDVTKYITGVFDYWESVQNKPIRRLSPSDIREIVGYLRSEFVFLPNLADQLDDVDQRLIRLTVEQAQILESLSQNDRLVVEGHAGSGKTLLALDFAKRRADEGDRVLYLTFNKNLARALAHRAGENPNLRIINIHALFGELVSVDTEAIARDSGEYFFRRLPAAYCDRIRQLSAEELEQLCYDQLVIDEGQDIIQPDHLCALDLLLRGGLEKGSWVVFYDEKQNIYNPRFDEGFEWILSYAPARYELRVNCRNTVQIGQFSEKISGLKLDLMMKEHGEEVRVVGYADSDDFREKIRDILRTLRRDEVSMRDVVILSPKRYAGSLLNEVGIEVAEIRENEPLSDRLPNYSTIQSFKGLDSKVVIVCDLDRIRAQDHAKMVYIAATRARTLLYFVAPGDYLEKHAIG